MAENFDLGWYRIEENWDLYVDGDLESVFVDYLHIEDAGSNYTARHYDRAGELITELSLDEDDLEGVLDGYQMTTAPDHI